MTMGQEQKGSLLLSSLTNGPQNNNVLLIRCKIRRILEKIILFRLIYFSSMVNPKSCSFDGHFMARETGQSFFRVRNKAFSRKKRGIKEQSLSSPFYSPATAEDCE